MNDDTISRRSAIDALVSLANHDGAYGYIDAKEAEDTLNALPTVEPDMARAVATIIENEKDMRVIERNADAG